MYTYYNLISLYYKSTKAFRYQRVFDFADCVIWAEPILFITGDIRISAHVAFPFLQCVFYDIRQSNRKNISIW